MKLSLSKWIFTSIPLLGFIAIFFPFLTNWYQWVGLGCLYGWLHALFEDFCEQKTKSTILHMEFKKADLEALINQIKKDH